MEKIWLKNYPAGVPETINPDAFSSLVGFFEDCVNKYAGRSAIINMGKTLTYKDVDKLSAAFAAWLQNHTDLKPGDRIAIQMPNLLQYPVVMFGALRAGLIVVNTNPLYTAREVEHQLKDSGAKAIVVLQNFGKTLQEALPNTTVKYVILTEVGDLLSWPKGLIVNAVVKYVKKMVPDFHIPGAVHFKETITKGQTLKLNSVYPQPDDIAFLQYTGGTTGVAKGAMLTHRNILANIEQIKAWIGYIMKSPQETVVTPLPLYHIFALTAGLFTFFSWGGRNLLITNPRDIKAYLTELQKTEFTFMLGVNTLYNAMLNNPLIEKVDFSKLKVACAGGMALQQAVVERWKSKTGTPLLEGFGLTETSPVTHFNPVNGQHRTGFIGMPVPSTEVTLMDDNGNEVALGQPGELCIRGPQVMKGYWNRPDETALVITPEGWLKTGDIAIMDNDGYFKIVDRKKDMILVSGFNVYPNEVEDVVALHPGVLEVAAVGVKDDKTGEAVKIFVVKKDPNLTALDLEKHCRENLTGYKIPKYIEFRSELPKTNIGKILRRALKS